MKKRAWLVLVILALAACSKNVEPPDIYSPRPPVDYSACRDTSFNLKYSTPQSFKSLVTCLNGTDGALQPIKTFVDSVPDEKLAVLLNPVNKHLGGNDRRFSQAFELMGRLNKAGLNKDLYKNIEALTRTGSIQSFVPIAARVLEDANEPGKLDPKAKRVGDLFPEMMDRGLVTTSLRTTAGITNSKKAKVLAWLLSRERADAPWGSDKVTDLLIEILEKASKRQTWVRPDGTLAERTPDLQRITFGITDPGILRVFNRLSEEDVKQFASLASELVTGVSSGQSDRLKKISVLVDKTDHSLRCFDNGKMAQYIPNMFDVIVLEGIARKKETDLLNRFALVEAPILMSATAKTCDLDPLVPENFPVVPELAQKGLQSPMINAFELFMQQNRLEQLKGVLKNETARESGPVLEAFSVRLALHTSLELLKEELNPEEQKRLSEVVALLAGSNLRDTSTGSHLTNWIQVNMEGAYQSEVRQILSTLPIDRKTLADLIIAVDSRGTDESILALRAAVASSVLANSAGDALNDLIRKVVIDPEAREELKLVARNLVSSWQEEGAGWGYLLGFLAESEGLARERPLQDFMRDVIADDSVLNESGPVLIEILKDKNGLLRDAIGFVGYLARNGELESLVNFVVDLSSQSVGSETLTEGLSGSYKLNRDIVTGEGAANAPKYSPIVPKGDYSDCLAIKGDLFQEDGKNLYHALRCLDSRDGAPGFANLAEKLKDGGLLGSMMGLLSRKLLSKDYIHQTLEDLRLLNSSGDLAAIMDLLSISLETPYELPAYLEQALRGLTKHPAFDSVLKSGGIALAAKDSDKAVRTLLDIVGQDQANPSYIVDEQYTLNLYDIGQLWQKTRQLFPKVNEGQLRQEFNRAAREFSERPDSYYKRPGYYPNYSNKDAKREFTKLLTMILRNNGEAGDKLKTDLGELFRAQQDLAKWDNEKKINVAEFFKWGVSEHRVVPYWVGENDEPEVRLVTPLDQLDLLVLNSDVEILPWIPGVGVKHAGIFFQYNIATSENLADTLVEMKKRLKLGEDMSWLMNKETKNRLKNMTTNFEVLQEAERLGHMKILQRIYQGLLAATPDKYKKEQDPENNHMHFIHFPVLKWGFMSRMVLPLSSVRDQGQLEALARGYLKSQAALPPEDAGPFDAVIRGLLAKTGVNEPTVFDQMLDGLFEIYEDPERLHHFKASAYHAMLGGSQVSGRFNGVLEALRALEDNPAIFVEVWDELLGHLETPDNFTYRFMTHAARLSDEEALPIKELFEALSAPDPENNNESHLAAFGLLARLLLEDQSKRPALREFRDAFYAYKADGRVKGLKPALLMKKLFVSYKGTRAIIRDMLNDPADRKDLLEILNVLVERQILDDLLDDVSNVHKSGDITRLINFITTYIQPVPH